MVDKPLPGARQLGTYNCWDTLATARLAKLLPAMMEEKGDPGYYKREVWSSIPATLAMQARGLPIDENRLAAIELDYDSELEAAAAEIQSLSGRPDINLRSPQQRAELLFDHLAFKKVKLTPTGHSSTDQEVLDSLYRNQLRAQDDRRPILESLFHLSKVNTIVTRYLKMYPRDGKVFPIVKFAGTVTERFAYSNPPIQQFPKQGRWLRIREAFRASPGNVFVSRDYSQLEARILAILANDVLSLDAFARGDDIHVFNALDLFSYSLAVYNALTEVQQEGSRNYSKSFLYKISYGGRSELLKAKSFCPCPICAEDIPPLAHLNRAQAKAAGDRWHAKHYPIQEFRRGLRDQVTRFRYYESVLGGRRYVYGMWRDIERVIYNLPMQWTASQIVRRAMRNLHDADAPIVLNMHDQLVLEVPEHNAAQWGERMGEIMEAPIPELSGTVLPTKLSIGERWSDL